MYFAKMHGLGNDFIVIENMNNEYMNLQEIAVKSCDRHFGVGADGLLIVEKSNTADIRMEIINSDGSIAEMCGNGIRCFTKYVYEKDIIKKDVIEIETLAGTMVSRLKINNSLVEGISVDMGRPVVEKALIPFKGSDNNLSYNIDMGNVSYRASTIVVGVPHTIIFVDDIDNLDIAGIGRKIENMDIFPERTNVNFVSIVNKNNIKVRTWERGAGLTLACGTGTCASVVASFINGFTNNKVTAQLYGGNLSVDYSSESIFMEGPAEFVCEGSLFI